jgi:hypothetical protein
VVAYEGGYECFEDWTVLRADVIPNPENNVSFVFDAKSKKDMSPPRRRGLRKRNQNQEIIGLDPRLRGDDIGGRRDDIEGDGDEIGGCEGDNRGYEGDILFSGFGIAQSLQNIKISLQEARARVNPLFPVSGHDLEALGLSGPDVGRCLAQTRLWWIKEDMRPNRQMCLEYIARNIEKI